MTTKKILPAQHGTLIWITGYPNCGKTTVAYELRQKMLDSGLQVIGLDGDRLREIFLQKWGYDRAQRRELAKIYLRLCRELVSQNFVVILSAVAMFEELYEWVSESIESPMIVYLNVPTDERLKRDQERKKVYSVLNVADLGYQEPPNPDISIDNYGSVSPAAAASMIFAKYSSQFGVTSDDK
jgi:adenylylsulfate kinase-like enzyme